MVHATCSISHAWRLCFLSSRCLGVIARFTRTISFLLLQIFPRVVSGLGKRSVVAVAAAKHHTLVATSAGEVFSFGSNNHGRLGYAAVDSQPTPKKWVAQIGCLTAPKYAATCASRCYAAPLLRGFEFLLRQRGHICASALCWVCL